MFETPPGRCNCHQTRQRAIMKRCGSITNRNADEGKCRVQGRGAGRGQGRQSSEEGGNWAPSSRSGASIDTDTLPFDASGRNRPEMGGGGKRRDVGVGGGEEPHGTRSTESIIDGRTTGQRSYLGGCRINPSRDPEIQRSTDPSISDGTVENTKLGGTDPQSGREGGKRGSPVRIQLATGNPGRGGTCV